MLGTESDYVCFPLWSNAEVIIVTNLKKKNIKINEMNYPGQAIHHPRDDVINVLFLDVQ